MRLHILGRESDDKGTQLEILTTELLASLGYEQIKTNVASDAGEVDVDAVFITPMPVHPKETRVIAECKAHKVPLNMTNWLKFLGKLFVAKSHHADVAGCLIALTGVNGNVLGSYEAIKGRGDVRLIESTVLVEYLMQSHGLAPRQKIIPLLSAAGRPYLSIELAYYQRKVYWVITYDDGRFTIFDAAGAYPDSSTLDLLKPMIQSELEAGEFIDLREEAKLKQAKSMARKFVISSTMLGNGQTDAASVLARWEEQRLRDDVTQEFIGEGIERLLADGTMVKGEGEAIKFAPEIEADVGRKAKLFVEFGSDGMLIEAIGCDWWDRQVDSALLRYACETVQAGLTLDEGQAAKALKTIRISPGALMYALRPDLMIVTHRTKEPVVPLTDEMIQFDRSHFMRTLYNGLLEDFMNGSLTAYIYDRKRIEAISRTSQIHIFDRDGEELIADEVSSTSMIGEWHEKTPDGKRQFVHMATFPDYRERKKASQSAKPESATAEAATSEPQQSDVGAAAE